MNGLRVLDVEELFVEIDLNGHGVGGGDPLAGRLELCANRLLEPLVAFAMLSRATTVLSARRSPGSDVV